MNKTRTMFGALAVFQMTAVVVPVALAQGASFVENFDQNVLPVSGTLQESGPLSPAYTSGRVVFTGAGLRSYLRTTSNYNTTNFVAEVTITVASGFGGWGIGFIGLGAGSPNCGFFCEPMTAPNIYARIGPNDFGPFVGVTNATEEHIGGDPADGGDGTHRIRITWNHGTGEFTFAIHRHYTGGPFVPTTTIGRVTVTDEFGDSDSRIFFGGAGNATFDDLRVLALAGTPGGASCHGESGASLAREFGGMANAARALQFQNVTELQSIIEGFCGARLTGTATGVGLSGNRAGVQIVGRFTSHTTINLGASTLTITNLLDEKGGDGELVRGLPLTLSAMPGSGPDLARFEDRTRPNYAFFDIKDLGRGELSFRIKLGTAAIASPALCSPTRRTTGFRLDDGLNVLVVSTEQPWICFGPGNKYLKTP